MLRDVVAQDELLGVVHVVAEAPVALLLLAAPVIAHCLVEVDHDGVVGAEGATIVHLADALDVVVDSCGVLSQADGGVEVAEVV